MVSVVTSLCFLFTWILSYSWWVWLKVYELCLSFHRTSLISSIFSIFCLFHLFLLWSLLFPSIYLLWAWFVLFHYECPSENCFCCVLEFMGHCVSTSICLMISLVSSLTSSLIHGWFHSMFFTLKVFLSFCFLVIDF